MLNAIHQMIVDYVFVNTVRIEDVIQQKQVEVLHLLMVIDVMILDMVVHK
jgi:hypothetical protein